MPERAGCGALAIVRRSVLTTPYGRDSHDARRIRLMAGDIGRPTDSTIGGQQATSPRHNQSPRYPAKTAGEGIGRCRGFVNANAASRRGGHGASWPVLSAQTSSVLMCTLEFHCFRKQGLQALLLVRYSVLGIGPRVATSPTGYHSQRGAEFAIVA